MATGQTIADEVRTQLNDNDASNRRWSDAELLGYINAALRQIVFELPESNAVEVLMNLVSDVRQSIPTGGVKFLGAWNYDAVLGIRGPAITTIEMDALNSFQVEWSYPGHLDANMNWPSYQEKHSLFMVEHVAHDQRDPTKFYVFPIPTATDSGAVLLEQDGVFETALFGTTPGGNLVKSPTSITLPDGSDNRLLIVYLQSKTGTLQKDLSELEVTYGGVLMNELPSTFTVEQLDGVDIGQVMYALSVNGQTFSDEDLVIDGTAWSGTLSSQIMQMAVWWQVWDNIDPTYADFSFGADVQQTGVSDTLTLSLDFAEPGDLVVSFATSGVFGSLPTLVNGTDFEITVPASHEGYTYEQDDLNASGWETGDNVHSRVAYSTTIDEATATIEWTHGTVGGSWDPLLGWGVMGCVFPQIAGGTAPQIYVRYSANPTELATLADPFGLRDEFINAAVDYVTFRALMKDGRNAMTGAQRMQLWNNFLMALGKKPVIEQRVDPQQGRAGGDGNG